MNISLIARPLVFSAVMLVSAFAAQSGIEKSTRNLTAEAPVALAPFEVTGSRVKRVDYETPVPVVTFTAEAIEDRGYDNLGDFMQSLPYNSGQTNTELTIGSFVAGAAAINPRGLGANRSLTLINGRRAAPHGLADSFMGTPQSMFDFNSVPASAVERVEFLKDGASALYGSDAISGVMNIILKENYRGSVVDFSLSNTLKHDSLVRRVSVSTGMAARGWRISGGAQVQSKRATFIRDYGIATTDFRYLGPKGANLNPTVNHPTYLNLTAAQANASGLGTAAGFYVIPGAAPIANPTKASFVYAGPTVASIPDANRYNIATAEQLVPASESYGGHASLERTLTPALSAFAQFAYQRRDLHTSFPPFPFAPANLVGLTLSAANPYNPLGLALTDANNALGFGFLSAPRASETRNRTTSALTGVRGKFAQTWSWETSVSYALNQSTQETDLIRASDLQATLSGTTRATAYNPFGPSDDPNLVRNLFTRVRGRDGETKGIGYSLTTSGRARQLPLRGAGEAGLAAGYEFRRESIAFETDPAPYLGGGGGGPFSGHRNIHAVFVEFSVPLQKWLELQFAGRHENYSDFGQTTKPKVSAKVRLPANRLVDVLLRGSYSESFKAPDLSQLYQTRTLAVTTVARDPLRPQDAARQVTAILGGNRSLQPENGKVRYAGAVLEFPAIKGLSLTADYFDIAIRDVIVTRSIAYLVSLEGQQRFPDAIIRDNSGQTPGPITAVNGIADNIGFQLFRGWDFGLKYALRQTRLGSFSFHADATRTVKQGRDYGPGGFVDATGRNGVPVWRTNLGLNWRREKLSAAINADIIGKFFNNQYTAAGWGENPYAVINPSVTWRGFAKMSLTVGSTNVFDHRPPPNGFTIRGFDDRIYGAGALGRTIFLRVRKEF